MIEKPQVVQTVPQPAAVIRITVPRDQIQTVMGPGFAEVMEVLGSQGIAPAGPFFAHHLRMDPQVFEFELGVPVAAPISPVGRVQPGELPAVRVARTVYRGPYENLGAAWGEFDAWIAAEGHRPAPDLWESYLTDPNANPDPAAWLTELNRPLLDR